MGIEYQLLLQKATSMKIQVKETEVFWQQTNSPVKKKEEGLGKMKNAGCTYTCKACASTLIAFFFVFLVFPL